MRAIVVGAGKMGRAIAHGLTKLDHNVTVADVNYKSLEEISGKNFALIHTKEWSIYHPSLYGNDRTYLNDYDVVVSAMPYHQNWHVAKHCVDNGIRYCDLGVSVPVSQTINTYAEENASVHIITDIGLAPGWINIIAEQECLRPSSIPTTVGMRVGGLPIDRESNTLRYSCTWSYDGLINEYKDEQIIFSEDGTSKGFPCELDPSEWLQSNCKERYPMLNTGVFIVKNTPNVKKLLNFWTYDEWMFEQNYPYWEQGVCQKMYELNTCNIRDISVVLPLNILQNYERFTKHNPYVRHFPHMLKAEHGIKKTFRGYLKAYECSLEN